MRRALLILAVLLSGCGDGLVGPGYPGEPLARVFGRLVPTAETEVSGTVRVALAWYPQWMAAEDPSGQDASALAIVTEDVDAQGTFPADFEFPVYRPPPETALAPLAEGLAGRGAFGILLAYYDDNGNGRLDPIEPDGAPADRVIASSLLGDAQAAFALVYVDSAQPPATGLHPGFNLVQGVNDASAAVVPLDTRTQMTLTAGGPLYDAFVCKAGWLTFLLTPVCGLSGGDTGEEGPAGFGFDGRVALDGTRLEIELRVTSVEGPHPDANVNVNGRVIAFDTGRGTFVLEEDASTLLRPGASFIVSATAAGTSIGRVFTMPGEFDLEAPAQWATVSASSSLVVRWTESAGASSYYAGYEGNRAGSAWLAQPGELFIDFGPTGALPGEASAFVEARVDGIDGQAFVTTALVRRRPFYFAE